MNWQLIRLKSGAVLEEGAAARLIARHSTLHYPACRWLRGKYMTEVGAAGHFDPPHLPATITFC